MRKLIGISGLIGEGKDTAADYLVKHHDFIKLKFADKLKDAVAELFDISRDMLEGDTPDSRTFRNKPDEFWSNELGCSVTPRFMLQQFGTECMRLGFYDGIWISIIKKKIIDNPEQNFVISDLRFPNEAKIIKSLGGVAWRISKGTEPEWWDHFTLINTSTDVPDAKWSDIHVSETAMAGYHFDKFLDNSGTLEYLFSQLDS